LIRSLFLPEKGETWGSFDYASQEPRLVVHYAKSLDLGGSDEFVHAFLDDPRTDFHQLAADLMGVSRKEAKTIGLGLIYGMGVNKLSHQLGVDLDEAKGLSRKYHQNIPFLKELADKCSGRASRPPYLIRTLLHRRCRFPMWEPVSVSRDEPVRTPYNREKAEQTYGPNNIKVAFAYKALNRLIQGSAADQTKMAMVELHKEGLLPLVQIHDELAMSVPDRDTAHKVREIMESCVRLHVPSVVDMECGPNWGSDNFAMLYDNGQIDGVLVVAPKGVYKNWQRKEVPEHLPEHIVADIVVWSPNHTKKQLEHLDVALKDDDNLKVLIMNVEAFSTDKGVEFAKQFLRKRKVFMAVDESTTIKNRSAKRTKNIVNVGGLAKYRRIATGSPITKTPMDLFSQCDFLDPHLLGFGSFFSFQARYCKMWRRSVGTHSFNQVVGYQNRRVYDQLKTIALAVLEQGVVTAANALTQILRLQQVCSGFLKTDDGKFETIPSNKLNELMEALEEVDGKVIIWANYTHDIYAIAKAIQKEYGEGTVRMYFGETKAEDRQQIVEDFQDPNNSVRFFVGQPRTGGYGLTLTEAKTVIYYSNSYDLEVRLQSEDRAHRIGQKNNVTYIDIVTEGTVDEKILSALRDKIDIASTVLKEGYKEWLI